MASENPTDLNEAFLVRRGFSIEGIRGANQSHDLERGSEAIPLLTVDGFSSELRGFATWTRTRKRMPRHQPKHAAVIQH
jgi:hypothetical protein